MSKQEREPIAGYEIRIVGHLNPGRLSWFETVTIDPLPDGTTLMAVRDKDQSSLHALLNALNDLGVTLLSVVLISASREPGDD